MGTILAEKPHGSPRGSRSQPKPIAAAAPSFILPLDPAMKLVHRYALEVAHSNETIFLLGETGVGKDILARQIHQGSPRAKGRFVQINCASLHEGLLESELFGHMRGAFTGANESTAGQLEMASGGTVFLDEIAELGPRLQAKLLHVLQEKVFFRVGGREPLSADVRFIAATNRDVDKAMADGSLRQDLYYRLSVVRLTLPPLRERPGDLRVLARFFAEKYSLLFNRPALAEIDESVLGAMTVYPFVGNVRELENMIKRAILLGSYSLILEELRGQSAPMLAFKLISPPQQELSVTEDPASLSLKAATRQAVEQTERRTIVRALELTQWNRIRAARLLDVSYRSLLYKIAGYAIERGVA